MNTIGSHNHFNDIYFTSDNCRKIAIAIKQSKIFEHIKPINLLKERLGLLVKESTDGSKPPSKKSKVHDTCEEEFTINVCDKDKCKEDTEFVSNGYVDVSENLFKSNDVGDAPCFEITNNSSIGILPSSVSLDTKQVDLNISVKSESIGDQSFDSTTEKYFKKENDILENSNNVMLNVVASDKLNKTEKMREKPNKNLFNLAASLLPLPSQFYDKNSLINTLENGNISSFINMFKEAIAIENQISNDDLFSIISAVMDQNAISVLPDLCNCLEYISYYSQALSDSFVKFHSEMKEYQDNILNCLLTMINSNFDSSITSFIDACYCINDWNRMWSGVLTKVPTYKFEEKYFLSCMEIFQKVTINSISINHDTMIIIISYIMRYYCENYEMYMADIWLYCVLTTDLNSETDLKIPKQILDKVIDKLITMKNPSFFFVMNLLSKNWTLLCNNRFCLWLSELISDKSDVKKSLLSVRESIELSNGNDVKLNNSFMLLSINVIDVLNKKSLFTCSKNIFDTFVQNKLDSLKILLTTRHEKFKYKWIMVECLVSSTEYKNALNILKEFDALKDLEISFIEYSRVKEILPNLVWHLLNTENMLPVIDLFEQVVSIFIFNENNDSSYTKNCNEIFDLIVRKAFESNDKEVVIKMISLLDHILSADIEFNISKECLRYLLVSAVRTDIPFNELLDFIDLCFKFEIFEPIKSAADGFGSFVEVYSNLAKEEVSILTTWLCRHVKVKLVDLAQTEGASIRENLMKVCSLKFVLRPSKTSDNFIQNLGSNASFCDLLPKFTEALNGPKYLSHPIKFTTNTDLIDEMTIICDNRVVYNAIYYSDI